MQRVLAAAALGSAGYAAMRRGLFGANEWIPPMQQPTRTTVHSGLLWTRVTHMFRDPLRDPESSTFSHEIYYRPVLVPMPIDDLLRVSGAISVRGDKILA